MMMLTCRDGRLLENDRLIAVDGHLLSENSSLEDAVHWLNDAVGRVTLVVAHKADSQPPLEYSSLSTASYSQPPATEFTVGCLSC